MIELDNVGKWYVGPDGAAVAPVLERLDLRVAAGASVAVVGPSGSGKSTLLNLIGALDRPSSGTVRVNGRDVNTLGEADLAALRNREIGFVFQLHHLLPQCTVFENVLIPTLPAGGPDRETVSRARELLQRVGLGERLDYRPGRLSGGERQRVAVVRAMINRPKLLLADEPTGSLDHEAAAQLVALLVELNQTEGVTLVMVTHARDLAERMQQLYVLRGGRLATP